MQTETQIEVMPEFLEEFPKIAEEYRTAKLAGDKARIDEVIDFHLRCLFQEQCNYMKYLSEDISQVPNNISNVSNDEVLLLLQNRARLEALVFDDKAWSTFSQKLKNGNSVEFSQIGKYAN